MSMAGPRTATFARDVFLSNIPTNPNHLTSAAVPSPDQQLDSVKSVQSL